MTKREQPVSTTIVKTFRTLSIQDWKDLSAVVKFADETMDQDTYPEERARLDRVRTLLTDLYSEWREEHHNEIADDLWNAINLTDKKHFDV
jgi:hypothetical protein